jgi:hypothetical protein
VVFFSSFSFSFSFSVYLFIPSLKGFKRKAILYYFLLSLSVYLFFAALLRGFKHKATGPQPRPIMDYFLVSLPLSLYLFFSSFSRLSSTKATTLNSFLFLPFPFFYYPVNLFFSSLKRFKQRKLVQHSHGITWKK